MRYHIKSEIVIEKCNGGCINDNLHFNSFLEALHYLDKENDKNQFIKNKNIVFRYNGKINYNCGETSHYKDLRKLREQELMKLLGKGIPVISFVVDEGDDNLQIQEIRDNGIMIVYSYETHKRITIFTPHPNRIISLYAEIGEFPPENLIIQSEHNFQKGYCEILR